MTNGVSVEALQAIVDAFNDHHLDGIMGFFADDCVLEMPERPIAVWFSICWQAECATGTRRKVHRSTECPLWKSHPLR
jgi:hypothetical protein